ncbi:MAG: PadR family transcriptional regulator [Candidatus Bathyarchaeota archaeon]|nr:PadR family transcriptional regulator [Candidatus Bathyarchaeota archaeon]
MNMKVIDSNSDSSQSLTKNKIIPLQVAKSKLLKAFLEFAVLKEIDSIRVASVPFITEVLVKKHLVYISAGTIYPVFERLEKIGYIEKLPNRATRMFAITVKGKKTLENIRINSDELKSYLCELIS